MQAKVPTLDSFAVLLQEELELVMDPHVLPDWNDPN